MGGHREKERWLVLWYIYFHLSPGIKEGKKYKLFSAYFDIILFSNVHFFSENFSKLGRQKEKACNNMNQAEQVSGG